LEIKQKERYYYPNFGQKITAVSQGMMAVWGGVFVIFSTVLFFKIYL